MKFASKFTYFNQRTKEECETLKDNNILRKKKKINVDEQELFRTDVNVMSIGFAFLKAAQKNIGTGDAIFCTNCKSVMNSFSKLMNKEEYLEKTIGNQVKEKKKSGNKEEEEEKKEDNPKLEILGKIDQKFDEIKSNESIWICEFCEHQNKFMIEEEEIPKKNDVIYITESKNQSFFYYFFSISFFLF